MLFTEIEQKQSGFHTLCLTKNQEITEQTYQAANAALATAVLLPVERGSPSCHLQNLELRWTNSTFTYMSFYQPCDMKERIQSIHIQKYRDYVHACL